MTQTQVEPRKRRAASKSKNAKRVISATKGAQGRLAYYAKLDKKPMIDIWKSYKRQASEDMRNYLMEKFIHLVRYNAERIYTRLPNEVDIEDLMSAGQFGLMDAIDAFDLSRPSDQRVPPYYRLDAGFTYARTWGRSTVQLRAFVVNLLDRNNVYDWSIEETQAGEARVDRTLPGRHPVFSFRFAY